MLSFTTRKAVCICQRWLFSHNKMPRTQQFKQCNLLSHSSRDWEVPDQHPALLVPNEGSFWLADSWLLAPSSHDRGTEGETPFCYKAIIPTSFWPFLRTLLNIKSRLKYLCQNVIMSGFKATIFKCRESSVYCNTTINA